MAIKLINQCDSIWPDAVEPENQNIFFLLALLCSQFTTLPNQLGLEREKGEQKKLTLLITDKECYFISLFYGEKKICGGQMVKSLKNLNKEKWKMTPIPNFFSHRKKNKPQVHVQIYQSEIVVAWNFNLSFPACIMVGLGIVSI